MNCSTSLLEAFYPGFLKFEGSLASQYALTIILFMFLYNSTTSGFHLSKLTDLILAM